MATGFLFAGLAHHTDNPGQRRLRSVGGDLDVQRAFAVDRTGKCLGARFFVDGDRLARDRCFIDRRCPARHQPIGGDLCTRTHKNDIAGYQRLDRNRPGAVGIYHLGLARGHGNQGPDRGMCATHGVGLERACHAKQKHQQCAFGGLADGGRTQGTDEHQCVDVEGEFAERMIGLDGTVVAAKNHRNDEERPPIIDLVITDHVFDHIPEYRCNQTNNSEADHLRQIGDFCFFG